MTVADGFLNLNYGQQKTAIEGDRLTAVSDRIPQQLAGAYTDIWNVPDVDWTFKRVFAETLWSSDDGTADGAATAAPMMPTAFANVIGLYDQDGCRIRERTQLEFERMYTADTTVGTPCEFTVVNRQIHLWPTPDSALSLSVSYQRRLATRTSSGAVQEGFYQADEDLPLWDDHHYILVIRAKILGLKDVTDPTYQDLTDEFGRLLDAMKGEYVDEKPPVWHGWTT